MTKRFEYEHKCAPYTDYTSVRDNDPIRRVTLVNEEGQEPSAYITWDATETTEDISFDAATQLLNEEL